MLIYFVRHGHPNYKDDCLTELGKKQAAAASLRLRECGIEKIFASTNGRALETAQYTADILGLDVVHCDFMREISFKPLADEPLIANGNPWKIADIFAADGISLADSDWQVKEPFSKSKVVADVNKVIIGFDDFLCSLGYKREGEFYRVTGEDAHKTIAIFSHGGSSTAAISHLLNIPFIQCCGYMHLKFTSITVIDLPNKIGSLIYPRLRLLNDDKHIEGITADT